MTFAAFSVLLAFCLASKENYQSGMKSLVLNEQELRFAGSALQTVLGNNMNAYVSFDERKSKSATLNLNIKTYH